MKLDRVITEKMFKCTSKEDVETILNSGADLNTCSRLAIDEVLAKIFSKRCHGTKELAIKMLEGSVKGFEVPDVNDAGVSYSEAAQDLGISPEERAAKIKENVERIAQEMPKYYSYLNRFKSDPQLKALGASEDDIKFSVLNSEVAICGQGVSSKKFYIMKRTPENIEIAQKEGDILYFGSGDQA